MASLFLRISAIGASKHPSVVSLAAYRAGERLTDERLGKSFDHTERADVVHRDVLLPTRAAGADWALDRQTLWNAAQRTDPGKRSRYAVEWMVTLPHELSAAARIALSRRYATALAERYGGAVDLAVHAPRPEGDARNHHAHLVVSARQVEPVGFGARIDYVRPWKDLQAEGKPSVPKQMTEWRLRWVEYTNEALAAAGQTERLSAERQDAFGLTLPTKPGWSRAVEGVIRAGHESPVVTAELNRYAIELKRRELDLKAIAIEQEYQRLLAQREADAERTRQAAAATPTAITTVTAAGPQTTPAPAHAPALDAEKAPPPDDGEPTDFAGWVRWRNSQRYDPDAEARAGREAWLAYRAAQREPAAASADTAAVGTERAEADQDLGR